MFKGVWLRRAEFVADGVMRAEVGLVATVSKEFVLDVVVFSVHSHPGVVVRELPSPSSGLYSQPGCSFE